MARLCQAFCACRNACAIDRAGDAAHGLSGRHHRRNNGRLIGDIRLCKSGSNLIGHKRSAVFITVEDGDLHAHLAEVTRRGFTEARRPACDHGRRV